MIFFRNYFRSPLELFDDKSIISLSIKKFENKKKKRALGAGKSEISEMSAGAHWWCSLFSLLLAHQTKEIDGSINERLRGIGFLMLLDDFSLSLFFFSLLFNFFREGLNDKGRAEEQKWRNKFAADAVDESQAQREILKRSQTWRLIKLFAETQESVSVVALFFSGVDALGGRRRERQRERCCSAQPRSKKIMDWKIGSKRPSDLG